MGELLLVLLEIFGELVFEVGGEFLIGLGIESMVAPFKKAQDSSLSFSIVGIVLLGTISACLFHLVVPYQITRPLKFQGISLLISPFLTGACLHRFGVWRRSHERPTTRIATFWGGALFGFSFSLVRLLSLRYIPHA